MQFILKIENLIGRVFDIHQTFGTVFLIRNGFLPVRKGMQAAAHDIECTGVGLIYAGWVMRITFVEVGPVGRSDKTIAMIHPTEIIGGCSSPYGISNESKRMGYIKSRGVIPAKPQPAGGYKRKKYHGNDAFFPMTFQKQTHSQHRKSLFRLYLCTALANV